MLKWNVGGLAVIMVIMAALYLPDLLTGSSHRSGPVGVQVVVKSAVPGIQPKGEAVKSNNTEPVLIRDSTGTQTKALLEVSKTLEEMPAAIAVGVAEASVKQLAGLNQRLEQQDAVNAKNAEVAQATIATLGKVIDRMDQIDTAVRELKEERAKAASLVKEAEERAKVPVAESKKVKPRALTEEPQVKEEASSSLGPSVNAVPKVKNGGMRFVNGVLIDEYGRTIPPVPHNSIVPEIVRKEYEAQRYSRTGRR